MKITLGSLTLGSFVLALAVPGMAWAQDTVPADIRPLSSQ